MKKQHKPGLGVKAGAGQVKIKKKAKGGRRIWIIIEKGVARGLRVHHGRKIPTDVYPGKYEGKFAKHPLNYGVEAVKIYNDPENDKEVSYLIPKSLPQQNVEFHIEEVENSTTKHD